LFETADARLYEAKFAGRDRVVGWMPQMPVDESIVRFR